MPPSTSQMIPLQKDNELKEPQPVETITSPHLFPDEATQAKLATTAITHDEQASEYDQKQDNVNNNCSDETKCAGIVLDRHTGELRRVPFRVNLRIIV